MDIVFGPDIAVENIHYGLLFTDRYSRMTYLYPLQNLTSDIVKQLESFFVHLGFSPRRLITDFDTKLIGGKAREYLNTLKIHVNAAPANRQDRNGLVGTWLVGLSQTSGVVLVLCCEKGCRNM